MSRQASAQLISGIEFRLSEVACQTPPRINPGYPVIYQDNAAWVREFLPFPDLDAQRQFFEYRCPMWDSMIYPDGMARRVRHSSCVTSLMFEIDDVAMLQQALFDEIRTDWVRNHRYGPAFANIFATIESEMSAPLHQRFLRRWQDWFTHVSRENQYRKRMEIPTLDAYLEIRRISVGLLPYIAYLEHVLGLDLTEQLAADPQLARAGELAVEHAMLVNDLYSLRWESFKGDYFNAVSALLTHDMPNLQAAIDTLCMRIQQADEALGELVDELHLRYPEPEMRVYLDGLGAFCAGNLHWSRETTRYNGRGNAWNGLRSGVVTLHHNQTVITPG